MFGGLAGENRDLIDDDSPYARFEHDVDETIGDRIRAAPQQHGWADKQDVPNDAAAFWSALANVCWFKHFPDFLDYDGKETEISYSFRAAGDLVAAIRGSGDYMDWYCSGEYSTVAPWIGEALASRGWRFEADGDQDSIYEINVKTGDVKKHENFLAFLEESKEE